MVAWNGDRYSLGSNSLSLRRPNGDYDLFTNDPSHGDIRQGQVGNCWFCAAMQVVAKAGQIPNNFLNLGASNAGVYGTIFYPLGVPAEIRVDDQLLYRGNNP
jgi:hypothetical protein